jgi:hypothetical protein
VSCQRQLAKGPRLFGSRSPALPSLPFSPKRLRSSYWLRSYPTHPHLPRPDRSRERLEATANWNESSPRAQATKHPQRPTRCCASWPATAPAPDSAPKPRLQSRFPWQCSCAQ